MDIVQFRLDFPEFADEAVYTDSMCTYWSTLAENLHSPNRFGSVYNNIIELYTAHCITMQAEDISVAATGGFPIGQAGQVEAKKVGSVSQAYDTKWSFETNGGWFNNTIYGRQYLQLAKMYGKGGMMAGFGLPITGYVI